MSEWWILIAIACNECALLTITYEDCASLLDETQESKNSKKEEKFFRLIPSQTVDLESTRSPWLFSFKALLAHTTGHEDGLLEPSCCSKETSETMDSQACDEHYRT